MNEHLGGRSKARVVSELVGVLNVVSYPFRGFVSFCGVSDPIWWATSLMKVSAAFPF